MRKIERDILMRICEKVNSPRSLSTYLQLKAGGIPDIPLDYYSVSAYDFSVDYFLKNFLSKWKGFEMKNEILKSTAHASWLTSETQCQTTNLALRRLFSSEIKHRTDDVHFILKCARKVKSILGLAPSLNDIASNADWSNGSTFDLKLGASYSDKMTSKLTVTSSCSRYAQVIIGHDLHWCRSRGIDADGPVCLLPSEFSFVKGNRHTTVPKSSKTDRSISIEPTANIYLQKALGKIIRSKLQRFGVNLDDQTVNKSLASRAYGAGLSTIDLQNASDTLSSFLVRLLVPDDWYQLLNDFRSHSTYFENNWVHLQKFSSMGCGFTFELESLIFFAICESVKSSSCDVCSVYGDDIIVARGNFDATVAALGLTGFSVNKSKTFKDGNFFESCGGHYYKGIDVTPIYQKEISDRPEELIRLHNRLVRWSERSGYCVREFLPQLIHLFRKKVKGNLPRVPFGYLGDDGFLSDDSHLSSFCPNNGRKVVVYVRKTKSAAFSSEAAMLAYKLKNASFNCAPSNGHCFIKVSTRYTLKRRFIFI